MNYDHLNIDELRQSVGRKIIERCADELSGHCDHTALANLGMAYSYACDGLDGPDDGDGFSQLPNFLPPDWMPAKP